MEINFLHAFTDRWFSFFSDLQQNNNRDWFVSINQGLNRNRSTELWRAKDKLNCDSIDRFRLRGL